MIDLAGQFCHIHEEIEQAIHSVLKRGLFINGPEVKSFATELAGYLNVPHVIPCGNGTDAIQIALMGLGLKPGDEVIVPAFTYAAGVEAAILLGMTPVIVDVDPVTFNMDMNRMEEAVSPKTKAVIAVHLFGQCCDMAPLLGIASRHNLYIIEDNAQSAGALYTFPDGSKKAAGTIGDIGTTSFFPTKPLACYGDGGAMMVSGDTLAERLRIITWHGQNEKYHHAVIGCNSRLDTIQAAILRVKLKYFDAFRDACRKQAARYNEELSGLEDWLITPATAPYSTHVWYQYTLRVKHGRRDGLKAWLQEAGIPSVIYYPLPVDKQKAFYPPKTRLCGLPDTAHRLCEEVLSIPIHTELQPDEQTQIIERIKSYGIK